MSESTREKETDHEFEARRLRRKRRSRYQRLQAWVILAGGTLTLVVLLASGFGAALALAALVTLLAWALGREAR